MAPRSQDFVELVSACLKAEGPTDLANKLSLGAGGYQKVHRWRGGGRIDYEDVMVMLEKCGWLNMGGDPPAKSDDPLEELAATVAELALAQRVLLEHFELPLPEAWQIEETP